ncbi:hypothetical protein LINGRAHAP2_LOCUS32068, partial [Linum grandiflorum]
MWQWNPPSSAVITVAARCFFSSSAAALKPYHFFSSLGSSTLIRSLVPLPTSISLMSTIDEADVGILSYISKTPGFRGILKQRYSDVGDSFYVPLQSAYAVLVCDLTRTP